MANVLYHLRPDMREQLAGMVREFSKKGVSSKQKNETDKTACVMEAVLFSSIFTGLKRNYSTRV